MVNGDRRRHVARGADTNDGGWRVASGRRWGGGFKDISRVSHLFNQELP